MTQYLCKVAMIITVMSLTGCAGALVGDTQSGNYQSSSPERSHTQITEDGAISANIRSRYRNDSLINAADIQVSTYQNAVTLYGQVANRRVADRAVSIARSVNGVSRVVSKLIVAR